MTDQKPRGPIRFFLAILLSLFCLGTGQIYAGKWQRGMTIIGLTGLVSLSYHLYGHVFAPTAMSVAVSFLLWLLILVWAIWVISDAVRAVRESRLRVSRPWQKSIGLGWVASLGFNIALIVLIRPSWQTFHVPSSSNLPTIEVGDDIIADITTSGRSPHPGDIIALRYTRNPAIMYFKRVVGMPGDRVQMKAGVLYINDAPIPRVAAGDYSATDEAGSTVTLSKYTETLPSGRSYEIVKYNDLPRGDFSAGIDPNNTQEYIVPARNVFVLGDNRDNSSDSRFLADLGFVPFQNIVGKAAIVYFSYGDKTDMGRGIRWSRILHSLR